MANYAKYQQMLKAELHQGGNDAHNSAPFGTFGTTVTGHVSEITPEKLYEIGLKRLEVAAAGLPVTLQELAEFFHGDLESFGAGEVEQAGIVQAVRWYAFTYMQRSAYWWDRGDRPDNVVVLDEYRRSIR